MKQLELSERSLIFSTGAFLQPIEVEINGIKSWRWVLVGQDDPAYYDDEEIEVYDHADDLQGLLMPAEKD